MLFGRNLIADGGACGSGGGNRMRGKRRTHNGTRRRWCGAQHNGRDGGNEWWARRGRAAGDIAPLSPHLLHLPGAACLNVWLTLAERAGPRELGQNEERQLGRPRIRQSSRTLYNMGSCAIMSNWRAENWDTLLTEADPHLPDLHHCHTLILCCLPADWENRWGMHGRTLWICEADYCGLTPCAILVWEMAVFLCLLPSVWGLPTSCERQRAGWLWR